MDSWRIISVPGQLDENDPKEVLKDEDGKSTVVRGELWQWLDDKREFPGGIEP